MDAMNVKEWLDRVAPNSTVNAIATSAGVYTSTLDKQVKRGYLSAEVVIKIARAYKAPVVDALMQCGIITEEEADIRRALEDGKLLTEASDQELMWELLRRVDEDGYIKHPVLEQPLDNLPEPASSVTQLHPRRRAPEPDFTAMAAKNDGRDLREDHDQPMPDYE